MPHRTEAPPTRRLLTDREVESEIELSATLEAIHGCGCPQCAAVRQVCLRELMAIRGVIEGRG